MITMPMVLEFSAVTREYIRDTPVLQDVSFSVRPEEVVALLGRNGAGKTTLMHLAMGLLAPQRGSVRVFGLCPMTEPVSVKRRVGFVNEQQLLPGTFTVRDAIDFHRKLYPTWDVAAERELLGRFGLDVLLGQRLMRLSKGQRQQVSLLCAVCHRPELLLLDEPAAGLDPVMRREVLETAIRLLNREGTAIVFSSHHLTDVERLGGRVLLLRDAKLAIDVSLDALREDTCLAVVPRHIAGAGDRLRALPEAMQVRPVVDEWHAVLRGPTSRWSTELPTLLGIGEVHCTAVPLEEMFLELAGRANETVGV